MPFNTDTSVSNQAAKQSLDLVAGGLSEYDLSVDQRQRLVMEAINLRNLIRVKIADGADLDQASVSTNAIDCFMRSLFAAAESSGQKPLGLLQEL